MSFDENADALYADIPDDNLIKRTLVFRSNPDVNRIVFIVAPSWQRFSVSGIARAVAGPTSLFYRNGFPIGCSIVSTGKPGKRTPPACSPF